MTDSESDTVSVYFGDEDPRRPPTAEELERMRKQRIHPDSDSDPPMIPYSKPTTRPRPTPRSRTRPYSRSRPQSRSCSRSKSRSRSPRFRRRSRPSFLETPRTLRERLSRPPRRTETTRNSSTSSRRPPPSTPAQQASTTPASVRRAAADMLNSTKTPGELQLAIALLGNTLGPVHPPRPIPSLMDLNFRPVTPTTEPRAPQPLQPLIPTTEPPLLSLLDINFGIEAPRPAAPPTPIQDLTVIVRTNPPPTTNPTAPTPAKKRLPRALGDLKHPRTHGCILCSDTDHRSDRCPRVKDPIKAARILIGQMKLCPRCLRTGPSSQHSLCHTKLPCPCGIGNHVKILCQAGAKRTRSALPVPPAPRPSTSSQELTSQPGKSGDVVCPPRHRRIAFPSP